MIQTNQGLTPIKELAESVGLTKTTLYKIEIIQKEASPKYLEKVESGAWSIDATYTKIENDREIQQADRCSSQDRFTRRNKPLQGDFRDRGKEIPDNSIDQITTDPPYDEASLPLFKDLGIFAAEF